MLQWHATLAVVTLECWMLLSAERVCSAVTLVVATNAVVVTRIYCTYIKSSPNALGTICRLFAHVQPTVRNKASKQQDLRIYVVHACHLVIIFVHMAVHSCIAAILQSWNAHTLLERLLSAGEDQSDSGVEPCELCQNVCLPGRWNSNVNVSKSVCAPGRQ